MHNVNVNFNAPVTCTKSIIIEAPAKKVWALLTDINQWSNWQPDIRKPVLHGSIAEGASFDWTTGGARIHSILHTVEPYHAFGWTGRTFGLFAIHNWTLKEINGVTSVEVEESMEGWVARLFKKNFNQNLEKGMVAWLNKLKDKATNG